MSFESLMKIERSERRPNLAKKLFFKPDVMPDEVEEKRPKIIKTTSVT